MAYDANLDATFNPSVGGTPTAAWADIINANFAAIGAAWTSFTPTWAGGAPAIGNGTLTAAYRLVGKTLNLRIWLKAGSTTTFGAGAWTFTLPVGVTVSTSHTQILSVAAYDSSTGTWNAGSGFVGSLGSASAVNMRVHGSTASVGSANPWAWATSDELIIEGTIEVA